MKKGKVVLYNTASTPTSQEYGTFQTAYQYYNEKLWGGKLPNLLITLQRHAKAYGYFSSDRFVDKGEGNTSLHELALNPDYFGRTDRDILSTLVHEMCHVWQRCFDKPPRNGYHDRTWGKEMKRVGLYPSNTGMEGGKETGQQMTHYVIPRGYFDSLTTSLLNSGFRLHWVSLTNDPNRAKKAASKTKYTCPFCEMNVWGKPGINVVCGDCGERMES